MIQLLAAPLTVQDPVRQFEEILAVSTGRTFPVLIARNLPSVRTAATTVGLSLVWGRGGGSIGQREGLLVTARLTRESKRNSRVDFAGIDREVQYHVQRLPAPAAVPIACRATFESATAAMPPSIEPSHAPSTLVVEFREDSVIPALFTVAALNHGTQSSKRRPLIQQRPSGLLATVHSSRRVFRAF
jgi:hypothetical protein